MIYKCEVESCSNKTNGHLCNKCATKLKSRGFVYCDSCGTVLEVAPRDDTFIVPVNNCYVCKNSNKQKVWYYNTILKNMEE